MGLEWSLTFSDRNGKIVYDLDHVGDERRRGSTWYGTWSTKVAKAHAEWKKSSDAVFIP
ncbi:MAG: pectate lyase [Rhodopirellula sp. JB055]|uniref:pectate lyase n=1 Tax=Rhodopirellula sp. JB055 TaxID=3342846 RepID=UPI00370B9B32